MNFKGFFSGKFLPWLMFLIGTRGGVLVLDVHRVDFATRSGVLPLILNCCDVLILGDSSMGFV